MAADPPPPPSVIERQIEAGTERGRKAYGFDEHHDSRKPAQFWFQESVEGEILFVVFYTQACRWSRCTGCNLPSRMSKHHVGFGDLMAQVDHVLDHPEVQARSQSLRKVIVSNNGSVLDEATFSSTALMYLVARLNLLLPNLAVLALETRAEYVDPPELEFLARALKEGATPTTLELAVGFEAFDDQIRNRRFLKGLTLAQFEKLCAMVAAHQFRLKCYFMQKPVPGMTDDEAVRDIHRAIEYLDGQATQHGLPLNVHLNPTYVATGTPLAQSFAKGEYVPPRLVDVARAALHARGRRLTVFVGLSDEGLACPGGSFIRPGDEAILGQLEAFNRSQDYDLLQRIVGS